MRWFVLLLALLPGCAITVTHQLRSPVRCKIQFKGRYEFYCAHTEPENTADLTLEPGQGIPPL